MYNATCCERMSVLMGRAYKLEKVAVFRGDTVFVMGV